jgi:hypothetical protein
LPPSCQSDRLGKALEKHHGHHHQDRQRHVDLVLAQVVVKKRILDRMFGGVGRRQRHGDDEVRGGESEQHQGESFALPAGEQVLEERDGALSA